jgi:phage nucleotide-binding protein
MSPKTSDLTLSDHKWGILLYGAQGAGKTHFIGTMPKPIFVFDWDGGVVTLRGQSDIDYITIRPDQWGEYEKFWSTFIVNRKPAVWAGETFHIEDYATLALDSLTTKVNVLMELIADKVIMKDRLKLGGYKGAHRADYNLSQTILGAVARELLATNRHVVVTAHERLERDEATGAILRIGPSLSPSAFNTIAILLDEIWRLASVESKDGYKRVMVTNEEGRYIGKARALPESAGRIVNPTFEKVLDIAEKSK